MLIMTGRFTKLPSLRPIGQRLAFRGGVTHNHSGHLRPHSPSPSQPARDWALMHNHSSLLPHRDHELMAIIEPTNSRPSHKWDKGAERTTSGLAWACFIVQSVEWSTCVVHMSAAGDFSFLCFHYYYYYITKGL